MGNVGLGRAAYLGLPYYGRWLLVAARVLVEKHHITLGELTDRMAQVKARYEAGLEGRALDVHPQFEGDGSHVRRNRHHTRAVGKGDPQVYSGQAAPPVFRVGDMVRVRELPILFYTRTPEYVRALKEKSRRSRMRASHPRMRPGTAKTSQRNGSTSFGWVCCTNR